MGYKRGTWEQLSPATQARYRRAGIGPEEHAAGKKMQPNRVTTPEQKHADKMRQRRARLGSYYR